MAEPLDGAVLAVAEVAAQRDDRPHEERRDEGEERGDAEHDAVGARREQVFLEDQLHAVGERLQQAERAGLVRPDPVLHARHDLALVPDHEHRADQADDEDDDDLEQDEQDRRPEQALFDQWIDRQHQMRSIRTSVTGAVASMISSTVPPGWLNGDHTVPRGTAVLATIGMTVDALALTSLTSSPAATPSESRSSGWTCAAAPGA